MMIDIKNKKIYIVYYQEKFNENHETIMATDNEAAAKKYCEERNIDGYDDIHFYYKELPLNKCDSYSDKYLIEIEEYDLYKDKDITINKRCIFDKGKYKNKAEYNPLGYLQIQIIIDKEYLNIFDEKYCKDLFYTIKNKLDNGMSLDKINMYLNIEESIK